MFDDPVPIVSRKCQMGNSVIRIFGINQTAYNKIGIV